MELLYLLARSSDQDVALAKNDIIMPVETKLLLETFALCTCTLLGHTCNYTCIYIGTVSRPTPTLRTGLVKAGGQHKSLEKF